MGTTAIPYGVVDSVKVVAEKPDAWLQYGALGILFAILLIGLLLFTGIIGGVGFMIIKIIGEQARSLVAAMRDSQQQVAKSVDTLTERMDELIMATLRQRMPSPNSNGQAPTVKPRMAARPRTKEKPPNVGA